MSFKLTIGPDAISSYKRLAYTPWHAIAEFVDNSTQSYFDNRALLDKLYSVSNSKLTVSVIYNKDSDLLRITDNAMGMSADELSDALHVALLPKNQKGRCRYGMGLKTAACWLGDLWTVKTKKYGSIEEYNVSIDVIEIAKGNNELNSNTISGKNPEDHYTIIEIKKHNRTNQGRTLKKIKDFLSSMYREDFRNNVLRLEWQGEKLKWDEYDDRLLKSQNGKVYKKDFKFKINSYEIHGWVGILERGSRADAGFSIIHCGRVVKGWPDSWRPASLYGQIQGSNDLVNQRLIGEIHLDGFDVSHTKDDILWLGEQEEKVEMELLKCCADYKNSAKLYRKNQADERGPSEVETATAIDELKKELLSPEMVDQISIENIPSEEIVKASVNKIINAIIESRKETLNVKVGEVSVKLYITSDMSDNDPYVTVEATKDTEIVVIINTQHPHWHQLIGSEGVLNYLRHCTYDALAEWQARKKASRIDPDTIKLLKDALLRVPFKIEEHQEENG